MSMGEKTVNTSGKVTLCIDIFEPALAGLFGSDSAYQVLMFLQNYEHGYASEIART